MYSWTLKGDGGEGRIWLGLDAPAAAAMIDVILGGRPYQGASGSRALTAIDRRLLGRVLDRAAGLVAGIAGIPQPLPRRQVEQMPKPPAVAALCFDLDIGGAMWLFGDTELCVGAKSETNGRTPRAKGGPIELSATLNVSEIADDQLSTLEVGDVIATDVSVEGEIIVRLAGIPKYVGQLSTVDGKKAITITRKITDQD
jgi:flagellar motor switch protein FliM